MLAKFLSFIIALLGLFLAISSYRYNSLKNINIALKTQITENNAKYTAQILKLEREKQNVIDISKEKKELDTAVQTDSTGFNWQYDIASSSPVLAIKRMHDNRVH